MWQILLAVLVVIIVTIACYWYVGRRGVAALFLGLAAGIAILGVLQPANTLSLPGMGEIATRTVLYVAIAAELALGVYLAFVLPTKNQVVLERLAPTI
jgi:hypothetical protein